MDSGLVLPWLSRNFPGPAVIVLTLIGCVVYVNHPGHAHSEAWGPAAPIIALYVRGVGVVSGLVLLIVGAVRARASAAGRVHARSALRLHRAGLARRQPVRFSLALQVVATHLPDIRRTG